MNRQFAEMPKSDPQLGAYSNQMETRQKFFLSRPSILAVTFCAGLNS
jgi:hypothetical protein